MKIIRATAFFSIMALISQASLQWEREIVHLQAHPLQETIKTGFNYTNTGSAPVKITKIDSSCGCLVAEKSNRTVQPGESGTLGVEFLLRGRSGKQKKHILVKTDEAAKKPFRLDVEVDIPESYIPSIQRVVWSRSEEYEPQKVKLVNHFAEPIELVEVFPSIGTLKTELVTLKPGFEYELTIHPDPGVENLRAFIRLKPKPLTGTDKTKDFKVYVFVK